jgi:hypothetical protein
MEQIVLRVPVGLRLEVFAAVMGRDDNPDAVTVDVSIEIPTAGRVGLFKLGNDNVLGEMPILTIMHSAEFFDSLMRIKVIAALFDTGDLNVLRHSQGFLLTRKTALTISS